MEKIYELGLLTDLQKPIYLIRHPLVIKGKIVGTYLRIRSQVLRKRNRLFFNKGGTTDTGLKH